MRISSEAIDIRAKSVIARLWKKGHEAYLVGGSVRDLIMGKKPKDWDICTSALPENVLAAFHDEKVIETGLKHGTVTVLMEGLPIEVTTFRIDGDYSDNRRPDKVEFSSSLEEDLARRDFTINAMAYTESPNIQGSKLLDPFGGESDINSKMLKAVGSPDKRIKEDALRILRALRFASVYSFSIDKQLSLSIHENKDLLKNISQERITAEFTSMICGDGAEKIMLEYADVIAVFIPEIIPMIGFLQNNKYHNLNVWAHTAKSVDVSEKDPVIRLALFFHDIGKPGCYSTDIESGSGHFYGHPKESARIAKLVMKRMKYDNKTIDDVLTLVYWHDSRPKEKNVIRMLGELGEKMYRKLLKVQEADIKAQAPEFSREKLIELKSIDSEIDYILEHEKAFKISNLAVDGKDLIDSGIPQGPKVGEALKVLLDAVMDGKVPNEKENLIKFLKN